MDFELRRVGGVTPIFDEIGLGKAEKLVNSQQARGINVKLLNRKEALEKEPLLNPDIHAAIYSRIEAHVNPMRLTYSLVKGAENNNANFSFYNPVTGIQKNDQGLFEVYTKNGSFLSEQVVIAGGPWSKEIGRWLDVDIPLNHVKGQLLVTEPLRPLLKHIVKGMRQTDNGEILIGNSKEDVGFDNSTSFHIMKETAELAKKTIPSLKDVRVVRHFAGVRAIPIDGLPILGKIPEIEGLYIAVTHSGITLAPIIGLLLSELLVTNHSTIPLCQYDIKRFTTNSKNY